MKNSKLSISFLDIKGVDFNHEKGYSLNSDDIVIYKIYLPDFNDIRFDLSQFLNSIELKRVKRFYKEIDKDRFIIYRSILKLILAAYTKLNIKNIYLDYDFNKKPYLASHPWLHFNISHSEDYATIAVSRKKVGMDIEYMSKDFNFTSLLPDVFNDNETQKIQIASDKKNTFYTLWTRKEAFVKALGKGIDEDFKFIPCMDGEHVLDFSLIKNSQNWQVRSFELEQDYLASIAYEGLPTTPVNIQLYNVSHSIFDLLEMVK